ncbi:MAG: efflux RND transporter periplasmic adaptor subunit [Deltaproteobacteria bacterium]|nr:efflux RND transporter periplasmic adaptor subunit [Deltaproteobacteria bacterium]
MKKNIWRTVAVLAVVALGAAAAIFLWSKPANGPLTHGASNVETAPRYHCPMHPTIVSDHPGDCPICGMRLVPIEDDSDPAATAPPHAAQPAGGAAQPGAGTGAGQKKIIYRSTMNASEFSDRPGKDSMGMDMVAEEIEQAPAGPVAVEGRAPVQLSERKRELIGIRTAAVEKKPLARTVRTVGLVTYDETHLHHVHTKISGWVEKLYANATGEHVEKGDPLLTIYSPELVASAQEYLLALHAKARLGASPVPSVQRSAERLVSSARQRLLLFDLTPQQIDALDGKGEVPTTMTLYAPISGHIITRNVTQGQQIEPGMNLLDIADLSHVWVLADIYEYELPFIHLGQAATMNLSYLPGRSFAGQVTLIYPVLNEQTRTIKARLEFANADYSLRPEMYAEVEIFADLGVRTVLPASAVISSGARDIVFVQRADGSLEPRAVTLGVRLPDLFEVLEGVAPGETVVTSGNFLLDSESKLKAALAASLTGSAGKDSH